MKLSTALLFVALQVAAEDGCNQKCGDNTACVGGTCEAHCHSASGCCSPASGDDAEASCSLYSTHCVCKFDHYCCDTAWDNQCIEEAMTSCDLHCSSDPSPIVATPNGAVRGTRRPDGVAVYGIPFAQAPENELRFMPPVKKEPWTGVFDGTKGPVCHQPFSLWTSPWPQDAPENAMTEDCLYVGVYVPPSAASDGPLPVYVFIHGGSFSSGDQKTVKAWKFALENNVIVVSVNYRLGMLGFFPLQQIKSATTSNGGSNGFLDQVMALEWVRDNIGSFGGNPDEVTLGGQSAGSISACALNFSPLTSGLFKRIAMTSFSCTFLYGPYEESAGMAAVAQQIEMLKVAVQVDLYALSLAELQQLPISLVLYLKPVPTVDGLFLTVSPAAMMMALGAGQISNIPLTTPHALMSATSMDGTHQTAIPVPGLNPESYANTMKQVFGAQAESVLAQYPAADAQSYYKVSKDFCVVCPYVPLAGLMEANQGVVSLLEFSYPTHDLEGMEHAAEHQADLNMIFGYQVAPNQTQFPYDPTTSNLMMKEYGKFINTGTGTTSGLGTFYDIGKEGASTKPATELFAKCPFWSQTMASFDLTQTATLISLASWCTATTGVVSAPATRSSDHGSGWYL